MMYMKKFILFFVFLASISIFAQSISSDNNQHRFKGGIRAGFTATQISGDDLAGFHKIGGYGGLFANVGIADYWKIQMEINFIMKGSSTYLRANENGQVIGNSYKLNLFYTETPILFKYWGFNHFEFEFGPSINFLFHYTEKENGYPIVGRIPFRKFEIAGVIGISYIIKEHYAVNLRYSLSIIPVRIPDWAVNRVIKKQFNDCIALSMFYQF